MPNNIYHEFRRDGFPFCPQCGEDELYTLDHINWGGASEKANIQDWIDSHLRCYRCGFDSETSGYSKSARLIPYGIEYMYTSEDYERHMNGFAPFAVKSEREKLYDGLFEWLGEQPPVNLDFARRVPKFRETVERLKKERADEIVSRISRIADRFDFTMFGDGYYYYYGQGIEPDRAQVVRSRANTPTFLRDEFPDGILMNGLKYII